MVTATDFDLCDGFDCRTTLPPHDRMDGNVGMAVRMDRAWICRFRHLGSRQRFIWRYIQSHGVSILSTRWISELRQMTASSAFLLIMQSFRE